MFQNIATVIVLIICSYVDIRQRKVEKRIAGIYAAAVLAGRLAEGGTGLAALFTGLVPGILFLFLSFVTRQGIGYGDSILILLLGASVGIEAELEILLLAFALSGIWAVALSKEGKRTAGVSVCAVFAGRGSAGDDICVTKANEFSGGVRMKKRKFDW